MVVMNWMIINVKWITIGNELAATNELDGNELDDNGCILDHNE
jgi:hypothetical protein